MSLELNDSFGIILSSGCLVTEVKENSNALDFVTRRLIG